MIGKKNVLKIVRDKDRPTGIDFINNVVSHFVEFHGDRKYGDDSSIIGGIGRVYDIPVTVIAQERGKDTKDRIKRNFGMAHPEGYRKALRLMKQAEKFKRPVICFLDTAGAYCGIGAEERGQGQAIADNLYEMSSLETPIISVLIGEGGSGGALGLAVSDRVWMLENSIYSVISPEGCASILWKDSTKVDQAVRYLKITSNYLYKFKVVDKVIKENGYEFSTIYEKLKKDLYKEIKELKMKDKKYLIRDRYKRYRSF